MSENNLGFVDGCNEKVLSNGTSFIDREFREERENYLERGLNNNPPRYLMVLYVLQTGCICSGLPFQGYCIANTFGKWK